MPTDLGLTDLSCILGARLNPEPVNAQLRLPLARKPDYSRARFAASPVNGAALALVGSWTGGSLALIGPEGSGKTHLANIWAVQNKAKFLDAPPRDVTVLAGQPLVIENAEIWPDPESLFHLLNMTQAWGALLLTSRLAPAAWPAALPDLRSRLNALVVAELAEPDDVVLRAVLTAFFAERHIRPAPDVIPYLLYRMERSIPAARAVVEKLDEMAAGRGREINRALALEVLGESAAGDLFG
jgi:chromosomal replication initiation ATPase DnaA